MANVKRSKSSRHSARPNNVTGDRSHQQVRQLVRAAFVQCLRDEGVSIRDSARFMRCSPTTAQRIASSGAELLPLRSHRLAWSFLKNLRLLVAVRNGRTV